MFTRQCSTHEKALSGVEGCIELKERRIISDIKSDKTTPSVEMDLKKQV
jgi:hypothetical protein